MIYFSRTIIVLQTFHLENEMLARNGWPKHHCVSADGTDKVICNSYLFLFYCLLIWLVVVLDVLELYKLPYFTLPYLRGRQTVTSAQRWGRISLAQCASPESRSNQRLRKRLWGRNQH